MTAPQQPAEVPLSVPGLSRRGALQSVGRVVALNFVGPAGAAAAAETNPLPAMPGATAADIPAGDVMLRLSKYISRAKSQPLPAHVIEATKWALLDGFAAIISGSQLPAGRAAIRFAKAVGGSPAATVIGDQRSVDPITAALTNGTMGHADETDDVLVGPWHPGCNVIPAAFAIGEAFNISGQHFLRAVALGYDIGSRVMLASGVRMDFRHPTNSMGGTWGAAAAAMCAAGLTAQQVRWGCAYAAQQCSGIDDFRRDPHHIEKAFMDGGMGARNGATAAILVLSGFDAVPDVMSGEVNFFSAYAGAANPAHLIQGLGTDYLICHALFKHWPVAGPLTGLLDSLKLLLARHPVDPNQISEVIVSYWSPGSITDNSGPPDVNMQNVISLMIADGKLTFRSVHDYARLNDPQIVQLRALVEAIPRALGGTADAAVTGGAPGAQAQSPVIRIKFKDGTSVGEGAVFPGPGNTANPYTRAWMVSKAHALIEPVLGMAKTNALIDQILDLENLQSLRALSPLLAADSAGPPRLSEWPM